MCWERRVSGTARLKHRHEQGLLVSAESRISCSTTRGRHWPSRRLAAGILPGAASTDLAQGRSFVMRRWSRLSARSPRTQGCSTLALLLTSPCQATGGDGYSRSLKLPSCAPYVGYAASPWRIAQRRRDTLRCLPGPIPCAKRRKSIRCHPVLSRSTGAGERPGRTAQ